MAKKDNQFFRKKNEHREKKKSNKGQDKGFSNLNQVTGVPKRHAFHSAIPVEEPKRLKKSDVLCPICGEVVEDIASSFLDDSSRPMHFECVISIIREKEKVREDETLSYIGKGNFGIFRKDEEGHYHLERTIPFENAEKNSEMKEYIGGLKE